MARLRWRNCKTCGKFTVVDEDYRCAGDPTRDEEGCGNEFSRDGQLNSKLQVRGGPTPKFHS